MSGDILIPAPSLSNIRDFIEWLESHFQPYVPRDFINFLFRTLRINTLPHLSDFLSSTDPKDLLELVGKTKYDLWRSAIIDLRVIK
jgi:hypothetical protein